MTLCVLKAFCLKKSKTNICFQKRKLVDSNTHIVLILGSIIQVPGYTTFFMLNSTDDEIYHAHKCENANNYWHLTLISMINSKYNI